MGLSLFTRTKAPPPLTAFRERGRCRPRGGGQCGCPGPGPGCGGRTVNSRAEPRGGGCSEGVGGAGEASDEWAGGPSREGALELRTPGDAGTPHRGERADPSGAGGRAPGRGPGWALSAGQLSFGLHISEWRELAGEGTLLPSATQTTHGMASQHRPTRGHASHSPVPSIGAGTGTPGTASSLPLPAGGHAETLGLVLSRLKVRPARTAAYWAAARGSRHTLTLLSHDPATTCCSFVGGEAWEAAGRLRPSRPPRCGLGPGAAPTGREPLFPGN